MSQLDDKLRGMALSLGADFYGVADLAPAHGAIQDQGGAVVAAFPRGISIGIRLLDPIVDQLPQRSERAIAVSYRHHCYDLINQRLDHIASRIGSLLQNEGYRAYPVPASKRADDERICAVFSHKLAARSAGLGWIGKSCLLITPGCGPRVRWATVLTDAPLTVTGGPMEEQCGDCRACVDACPAKAFTGEPFRQGEGREVRYDAGKCEQYFERLEKDGRLPVCGMCLYVCPHGKHGRKSGR